MKMDGRPLWNLVVLMCILHLRSISCFNCALAPRPEIKIAKDPAKPLIANKDYIMGSLTALFGELPGASIGLFIADKFLSGTPKKSPWDEVKDKVAKFVNKEIDAAKMRKICDDLKEFRIRIDNCGKDSDLAKTRCLKHLLDYMIGKEPHFIGDIEREHALFVGPLTIYAVMTLAVGNMFIKQNRESPIPGAATLTKIQPAARRYSEFANTTVEKAIKWRLNEIGHFKTGEWMWWGSYSMSGDRGVINPVSKRSRIPRQTLTETSASSVAAKLAKRRLYKRGWGGYPPVRKAERPMYWGKLVVTDRLDGKEIFSDEKQAYSHSEAWQHLKDRAYNEKIKPMRDRIRTEMQALYDLKILRITNQFWRVYEKNDFATVEGEAANGKWLASEQSTASSRQLDGDDEDTEDAAAVVEKGVA